MLSSFFLTRHFSLVHDALPVALVEPVHVLEDAGGEGVAGGVGDPGGGEVVHEGAAAAVAGEVRVKEVHGLRNSVGKSV